MILELVYVLLIIFLIYINWNLNKDLEKEYYKEDISKLGIGKFFFVALIFPSDYFKKNKVLLGWSVYLFMCITFILIFYLIFKLVGLLKF